MKRSLAKSVLAISGLSLAFAAQANSLSFIGAAPDPENDYVERALGEVFDLGVEQDDVDLEYANRVYWTLDKMGQQGVDTYPILRRFATSTDLVLDSLVAIRDAEPGVVFTSLGPQSEILCSAMAEMTDKVFVVSSGFGGDLIDDIRDETCNSPNIITVAGLNKARDGIFDASGYGEQVNFAAPTDFGEEDNPERVSPLTIKTVCAFSHIANLAAELPEWSTEGLLEALDATLEPVDGLDGFTSGSKALLTCPGEEASE